MQAHLSKQSLLLWKPLKHETMQRLKSGLGIVIDDFVANIYCLAINWGIYWALVMYGLM